jgi:hypothetical protein
VESERQLTCGSKCRLGGRAATGKSSVFAGGHGDRPTANPYFGVPDEENGQFAAEIYHAWVTPAVQTAQCHLAAPPNKEILR